MVKNGYIVIMCNRATKTRKYFRDVAKTRIIEPFVAFQHEI